MQPSEACYALIRQFEKLRLEAYPDPGPLGTQTPTIGYGHTFGVHMGDTCTEEQAEQWLKDDAALAGRIVDQCFPRVTQPQFDALTSFCYNVGPGTVGVKDGLIWLKERNSEGKGVHSTLMRLTIAGSIAGAAEEFPKWNKSGGVVMGGLTARREAERALFLTPSGDAGSAG